MRQSHNIMRRGYVRIRDAAIVCVVNACACTRARAMSLVIIIDRETPPILAV